jgi:AmmeMemoRadiSam system protein B
MTGPRLRDVETQPIQHQGQAMILLRDPLRLSETGIALPQALAPLLGLMDGTRDEAALQAAFTIRMGARLAPGLVPKLVADLDKAYLLDNERSVAAIAAALRAYREAPFRPMGSTGSGFSSDPAETTAQLRGYVDALPPAAADQEAQPVRGVISPHIDYQRGGPVYAEVWRSAAQAANEAELVIMFGTDHQGSNGTVTLTRQSYATPWGVLPTNQALVDKLAEALGEETAFAEELHHAHEHSIELAAVWLHFTRGGRPVALLPILCGGFGGFVAGERDPATYEPFDAVLRVLRAATECWRVLVVAAADLAHVGPAFGDPYGLDFVARAQLRNADERLLSAVYSGDATSFFDILKGEGDRRRVCGLPPIFLVLRLLENACGQTAGYAVCPADPLGLSLVTIAGAILC